MLLDPVFVRSGSTDRQRTADREGEHHASPHSSSHAPDGIDGGGHHALAGRSPRPTASSRQTGRRRLRRRILLRPVPRALPVVAAERVSFAYYPIDGDRALVRLLVTPNETAVYVDGFYAGIVDDFDDIQPLPLPPGAHDIVLYLEGYGTVHQRAYLTPGSTVESYHTMECLPAGYRSEPPSVAPLFPPPPAGSVTPPRTPRPAWAPGPPAPVEGTPAITY